MAVLPGSSALRGVLENSGTANISTSASLSTAIKEEEIASFPGRRPSPALADTGLVRGIGRGGLSSQPSTSVPLSSGITTPSNGGLGAVPSASEIAKRNILGTEERLGSTGIVQPLVSSISSRMILPQAGKANEGTVSSEVGNAGEAAVMAGRVFSPSAVSGMQWRPGSSFQTQNEAVCPFVIML